MTASAIHSPNKNYRVTSHVRDSGIGDTWTAIIAQDARNLLTIQNKGNGKVGIGIGTKTAGTLFEMKGNTIWEFPSGTVPINYIYFENLDIQNNPIMRITVASNVDEVEGYV